MKVSAKIFLITTLALVGNLTTAADEQTQNEEYLSSLQCPGQRPLTNTAGAWTIVTDSLVRDYGNEFGYVYCLENQTLNQAIWVSWDDLNWSAFSDTNGTIRIEKIWNSGPGGRRETEILIGSGLTPLYTTVQFADQPDLLSKVFNLFNRIRAGFKPISTFNEGSDDEVLTFEFIIRSTATETADGFLYELSFENVIKQTQYEMRLRLDEELSSYDPKLREPFYLAGATHLMSFYNGKPPQATNGKLYFVDADGTTVSAVPINVVMPNP